MEKGDAGVVNALPQQPAYAGVNSQFRRLGNPGPLCVFSPAQICSLTWPLNVFPSLPEDCMVSLPLRLSCPGITLPFEALRLPMWS